MAKTSKKKRSASKPASRRRTKSSRTRARRNPKLSVNMALDKAKVAGATVAGQVLGALLTDKAFDYMPNSLKTGMTGSIVKGVIPGAAGLAALTMSRNPLVQAAGIGMVGTGILNALGEVIGVSTGPALSAPEFVQTYQLPAYQPQLAGYEPQLAGYLSPPGELAGMMFEGGVESGLHRPQSVTFPAYS